MSDQDKKDFFISYTSADVRWAEWIAWHLEDKGYSVVIQKWDFRVGENFLANMEKAIRECHRTIAVTSPAYFASKYCRMEWTAALNYESLLPIRIEAYEERTLLGPVAYIDLVNQDAEEALSRLLAGILTERGKPDVAPAFPGDVEHSVTKPTHFPGHEPEIWPVQLHRNPHFTGREDILEALYANLHNNQGAVLTQAIQGLGGIGKTQLALEYAFRYQSEYDTVWWINAEEVQSIAAGFSALARKLGIPEQQEQERVIEAVKETLRQREHWLLIFDNVTEEAEVLPFIPGAGSGNILVTSRSNLWRQLSPLNVSTWKREESVVFLNTRTQRDDDHGAGQIADALGELPLALEQAAAYITDTEISYTDYLNLFTKRRKDLWADEEAPVNYEQTVTTTWNVSIEKVKEESRVGLEILCFFSFLAPDNIPRSFLDAVPEFLPDGQGMPFEDTLETGKAIKALKRFSLMEVIEDAFSIHRLVQHVVRDTLSDEETRIWSEAALGVVTDAWPGGTFDYKAWPECEALLPHARVCIEQMEELGIETETVGLLASRMGFYLNARAFYEQAEPLYQKALAISQSVLGENHPDTATSYNNLAGLYSRQGLYEQAEPLYQKALAIRESVLGENHPDTATSYNNLALLYESQGLYEQAEPLYQKALAIRESVLGENHPSTATSYNNLAGLYESQGLYEQAEPLYQKALAIRESVLGENHPDTATSYNNLALLYSRQGLYEQAEPLYQKALAISQSVLGENHPSTATSYNNLALLYSRQGLYEQAEPLYQKALAIRESVLGENHPDTATSYNNLAGLYESQGLYEQAEPLYQKALAISQSVLGENHPSTATSYNNLALLYSRQGLYEQAEPLLKKALAIYQSVLGENHPSTATSYNNLALLYESQGLYEQAEPLYQKALAIRESVLGENHPDTAGSYNNLALLYESQGLYEQAEPLLKKALAIYQSVLGENHPSTATSYNNLAFLYSRQGLYEQAEPLLKKALAISQSVLGENHPDTVTVRTNLEYLKERIEKQNP